MENLLHNTGEEQIQPLATPIWQPTIGVAGTGYFVCRNGQEGLGFIRNHLDMLTSFNRGVSSIFVTPNISNDFNLYLKANDTIIDESAMLCDWKAVGNDFSVAINNHGQITTRITEGTTARAD